MPARPLTALLCAVILSWNCGLSKTKTPKLIALGVDGMDPSFVEHHWSSLPHLRALRDSGYFARLATTTPPQSPVAWSTFITGLEPDQHGLYDFVQRDPATLQPFSSLTKTEEPKWVLPLGGYLLPLAKPRILSQRRGTPFWQTLSERGVPVIVQRMPTNYPPVDYGAGLSGMGTPDLLGTQGTFTFFTTDPLELARTVPGGRVQKAHLADGHAVLPLFGPPNPLRRDHALTQTALVADVDATAAVARFKIGDEQFILRQGEWSNWLAVEFELIPHISSVHGMVRIFAKQLHPLLQVYVSPINIDPSAPALPVSTPSGYASRLASKTGRFFTLGIPQDTAALRQAIFDFPDFKHQAGLVLDEEMKLLDETLREFKGGFLFFYFSSVDQNSHILWGRHEEELLKVYETLDQAIGKVRRLEPDAEMVILSDHGFTTFERAVHLNAWLSQRGFLALRGAPAADAGLDDIDWSSTEAYALGLNGLYLNRSGRERTGIVRNGREYQALLANLRDQLLAWRDPVNGRQVVETVTPTNPASDNKNSAPDLIVGYAPGYRASWQTGLGGVPSSLIEDNEDAWIGDHCVNAHDVPGVLFSSYTQGVVNPKLGELSTVILSKFGISGNMR